MSKPDDGTIIEMQYILLLKEYFGLLNMERLAVLRRQPRLKQALAVVLRLRANLAQGFKNQREEINAELISNIDLALVSTSCVN